MLRIDQSRINILFDCIKTSSAGKGDVVKSWIDTVLANPRHAGQEQTDTRRVSAMLQKQEYMHLRLY